MHLASATAAELRNLLEVAHRDAADSEGGAGALLARIAERVRRIEAELERRGEV